MALLAATASGTDAAPASTRASGPKMMVAYEAILRNGFSIRYDHRDVLKGVTRLFFTAAPDSGFIDVPTAEIANVERVEVPAPTAVAAAPAAPSSTSVGDIVNSAGNRHQIDPDFLNSVIRAESNFNPGAVSPKGAQGLMQLMPGTASKLGVKNSFEPADNIDGGARYMRELLDLYNGDAAKALAAYNAGPHRVQQYGGVPPYRETHSYVARVIRDYNRTKLAQHPELKSAAKTARTTEAKKKTSASTKSKATTTSQQTASAHPPASSAATANSQKAASQP